MATMLIGGLWHGASWQFVIWGGLNGLGLVVYKYWKRISPFKNPDFWLAHFLGVFITFNFITFTRIWFRGESMEITGYILHQVTQQFSWTIIWDVIVAFKLVFGLMLIAYVIHWLPSRTKEGYRGWFVKSPLWQKAIIVVLVVFAIYQTRTADVQPFIYFQF
jgi:D-alanyl-lipoteichoic acid acyltransferase DltB (MBOAT superfamily)